jgi:hypothetical protein
MSYSFSGIKRCSRRQPAGMMHVLIASGTGAGLARHIISQAHCAASLPAAALPNASTSLAPLVVRHAHCMHLGATIQPAACSSVTHGAGCATHLASRCQLSFRARLHLVGLRLVPSAGPGTCDGMLHHASISQSMWLHACASGNHQRQ